MLRVPAFWGLLWLATLSVFPYRHHQRHVVPSFLHQLSHSFACNIYFARNSPTPEMFKAGKWIPQPQAGRHGAFDSYWAWFKIRSQNIHFSRVAASPTTAFTTLIRPLGVQASHLDCKPHFHMDWMSACIGKWHVNGCCDCQTHFLWHISTGRHEVAAPESTVAHIDSTEFTSWSS